MRIGLVVAETPRYVIAAAEVADGELVIAWGDGHRSRFHPIWLRHQCACRTCGSPVNAVRTIFIGQIPEDIAPESVSHTGSEVAIAWSHDGHRSLYSAQWLRDHCYSEPERARRRTRPKLWDGRLAQDPPRADLIEAEADPRARLAMLQAVLDYGFCKIDNVPTAADQSNRLIALVGSQRQTHYGTYPLSNKVAVDNVGDTCGELRPHIDETYRLSTIGITVFQVFQPSAQGGDSILVDGFEAARRMREAWPEDFELLTKTAVMAERFDKAQSTDRDPKWFQARLPVIKIDGDGEVSGIRLNERQIAPLDLPADQIGPCYRALRRIFGLVYDPDLRLTFELKAGEGLLFDNHRVLHGRTEFTPEGPQRAVLTSSVDLEEFHSSLRILRMTVDGDRTPIAYPQGMAV